MQNRYKESNEIYNKVLQINQNHIASLINLGKT